MSEHLPSRCPSCGIAFLDHKGIEGTCRDLQTLRCAYAALAADAMNARTALRALLRVYDADPTAASRASNLARKVLATEFPSTE